MANSPNHTLSTEVLAGWERLYNLLGRGYAHIAQNSTVEAEILGLFRTLDAASVEGTPTREGVSELPDHLHQFSGCL